MADQRRQVAARGTEDDNGVDDAETGGWSAGVGNGGPRRDDGIRWGRTTATRLQPEDPPRSARGGDVRWCPPVATAHGRGTQLLATQNQLMQNLANLYASGSQSTQCRQAVQAGQDAQANRSPSNYGEFMRTKPPVFTEAEEPHEVEDWLCMIEKKLDLIRARDEDKASREDEAKEPDWAEFTAAFSENFVPVDIMKIKRDEFRTLRQDNLSV
ncbi:hypothetical protein E2562_012448 [Oryza meyeriana var. granulata]|uniref:Retrotransposon gag domain-containing protein n=1 Tax=Oryza meyeriana var. granulata TaxID=110450 RepID=A0A6G1C5I5_9ORYZ|nr:hypothetical protein E2562_012448 [Oryza meyeriana var. granulata]